jgi:hypothetical protein
LRQLARGAANVGMVELQDVLNRKEAFEMLNRTQAEFHRIFNLLRGTAAFEKAIDDARHDAQAKRQALLAQIEQAKKDHAVRLEKTGREYQAATARLEQARTAFYQAQAAYDEAARAWGGADTSLRTAIATAEIRLKETADRRIFRLRDWADSVHDLIRVSYKVALSTQRNVWTGARREVVVTNSGECAAACAEIKKVIDRCDQMLVGDYRPDPLPELKALHARVFAAAKSVECERLLPALDLSAEEPSWQEEMQARRDAATVAAALPAPLQ